MEGIDLIILLFISYNKCLIEILYLQLQVVNFQVEIKNLILLLNPFLNPFKNIYYYH